MKTAAAAVFIQTHQLSGGDIRITSSMNNAELYSIIARTDSLVVIELQLNWCVFHHQ